MTAIFDESEITEFDNWPEGLKQWLPANSIVTVGSQQQPQTFRHSSSLTPTSPHRFWLPDSSAAEHHSVGATFLHTYGSSLSQGSSFHVPSL